MSPGDRVILTSAPPSLLLGLPVADQQAIQAIVGQPIILVGIEDSRAELEFMDRLGAMHNIWVAVDWITPAS